MSNDILWAIALFGLPIFGIMALAFYRLARLWQADQLVRAHENAATLAALNLIYQKVAGDVEQHCYAENLIRKTGNDLDRATNHRNQQYDLLFSLFNF